MYIEYKSNSLETSCRKPEKAIRKWGSKQAEKIALRINQLVAADTFEIFCKLPGTGCHPLKGDRKGQWSVDILGAINLVFEPLGEVDVIYEKGELIKEKVVGVIIIFIGDYH